MMKPVSHSLKDVLVRQGLANGRAGTRANGGMIAQPAGTGAAGKGTGNAKSPAKFYREEMRQNRPGGMVGFDYVVHVNHAVPTSTRKRAMQTPFLVLVK